MTDVIEWTTSAGTKCNLSTRIFSAAEMQFDLRATSSRDGGRRKQESVYSNLTVVAATELRDKLTEFIEKAAADSTLQFGGYTLHRDPGGVDIKTAGGDVARLQAADLPEVIDWLTRTQP